MVSNWIAEDRAQEEAEKELAHRKRMEDLRKDLVRKLEIKKT